mmetsp:Transcript_38120/g.94273  ORF Transcript_38120/g.94273 Transcript_38120/m.94273 type:complete len:98 (+) Transcript_38120:89-382(+)
MSKAGRGVNWAANLKAISVRFSPSASPWNHVAAVRELLRQLRTPHAGTSDKLPTEVKLLTSETTVTVKMTFISGKTVTIPQDELRMRAMRAIVEDNA